MKVCLLSDTYPPDVGGLAVSVRRNACNLAAAGHQVHVVAPSHSRPPGSWHVEADGLVNVHRLGAHSRLRETLADWFDLMVELDVAQEFALFHGYFLTYAGYLAALTARYRGKPSVVSARGNDIDVMPFDGRRAVFVFKAMEWADAILAVTRDLAHKAAALSGRDDVRLVHNGVDGELLVIPQPPDPALRTNLGLDQRPVVGFVGEARAKKGLGRMLRIFPRLCQEVPAQLLLVGGVRQEDAAMVDFFRRQHPGLPLHLVPPQPNQELPSYYALCDVVILPSLRDGLPNTLLEAMACGRPVVASATGGMLDVVTPGVDGMLLSARDDHVWVEALRQVLLDSEARQRLGSAARQTALDRFTPGQELEAVLAVYEKVLSEPDRNTPPTTVPRPAPM
jgi:glycosyltransferase involved in cell wall biosynthesis